MGFLSILRLTYSSQKCLRLFDGHKNFQKLLSKILQPLNSTAADARQKIRKVELQWDYKDGCHL